MPENETAANLGENKAQKKPESQKKQQQALLVLLIVVAVGVAIVLYNNGVLGGGSSRRPVEQYLNAIASRDFDSYIESMPPRMAEDYSAELSERGLSKEDYMRELYSDYFEEFGENMTVSLEFTDRSRPDAEYVDGFRTSYQRLYGEEIRFNSVFEIDVTARFSGENSADDINLECYVVKSGGKWYIVGCDYETVAAEETE